MGTNEPSTAETSVEVFFPTGDLRQQVLEKVGQALGLRLLYDRKSEASMLINCFNEELQKQHWIWDDWSWQTMMEESWANYQCTRSVQPL